jgi:hypothetical protein
LVLATGRIRSERWPTATFRRSYGGSNPLALGRAARVRFYVVIVLANGSPITSVTVKLQRRYNDNATQLPYSDLASTNDTGASAGTLEVEHAFGALAAPIASPGVVRDFYLDNPFGLSDVTVNAKANLPGIPGDSVIVYAVLC